jgi:WD40 repeat protein
MDATVQRYQTYAEFQEAHEELMALLDTGSPLDESGGASLRQEQDFDQEREREKALLISAFGSIQTFMRLGAQGGVYIYEPKERRGCQALLDYWASICYEAHLDISRPILAPHDPKLHPKLDDSLCPYVGLEAFDEAHARTFFGRSDQVAALLAELDAGRRLVIVTGASGSGKSSLVLAGLVPALKTGAVAGSSRWRYLRPLVPGTAPLRNLAHAVAVDGAHPGWVESQTDRLLHDRGYLAALLAEEERPAVFVVDQFEEALTLPTPESSATYEMFVANLLQVVDTASVPHRVILTMRKDVEWMLARDYPDLNRRYGTAAFPVYSMESTQLRDAIEKPASLVGLKFQDGVVDELIKSVLGEDSSLPLLQFSLMALWSKRNGDLITSEAFRQVGSPKQAMAKAAQELYDSLPGEQQIAAEKVFLALSRFGDGTTVFRNRVLRRQLAGIADANNVEPVLQKFEAARLIRITRAPGEPLDDLVDVAHESLLRNWALLDKLFVTQRAQGERRAFLRKQADKWRGGEFNEAFLLAGIALKQASDEFASAEITPLEQEFLQTSAKQEQAREQARHDEEQRKLLIETERAQAFKRVAMMEGARAAEADRLALEMGKLAHQEADAKRRNARLFAVAAAAAVIAVFCAVYQGFALHRGLKAANEQAKQEIEDARDRAAIITRGAEGLQRAAEESERVAKAAKAEAIENQRRASDALAAAASNAKMAKHLAEEARKASRVADAKQLELKKQLTEHQARRLVIHSAFQSRTNSDLSVLLGLEAKSKDPAVIQDVIPSIAEATRYRRPLWRLSAELIGQAPEGGQNVPGGLLAHHGALTLSPDGNRLVVANARGLSEWNVADAKASRMRTFAWASPPGEVHLMTYSPKGRYLAAATDKGLSVWKAQEGSVIGSIEATATATRLAFNADESMLAAVTEDGSKIEVWSLPEGRGLLSASFPNGNQVLDAFFDANAEAVIGVGVPESGRRSFTLYRYAITNGQFLAEPEVTQTQECDSVMAYAAGGGRIGLSLYPVICTYETAAMTRAAMGRIATSTESQREYVDDIVYSKDGRFGVKLYRSTGEATITDFASGETLRLQGAFDLKEQETYEWGVSISGNGKRLAIQGNDGTVRGFELGDQERPFRQYGQIDWLSPDDSQFMARSFKDGRKGLALRDARTGRLVFHVDTGARELARAWPSSDGKYIIGLRQCQARSSYFLNRCLVALPVADGQAIETPYELEPVRAGDLALLRDGEEMRVYRAGTSEPVFAMPVRGRSRGVTSDGITLGEGGVFATKRVMLDNLNIEIYKVVDGNLRSYANLPAAPSKSGADTSFAKGGKFLVVKAANRASVWDLRGNTALLAFELDSPFGPDVHVNAQTARVVSRRSTNEPWEIRDLVPGGSSKASLPAGFTVDPSGSYAWTMLVNPDRLEIRSLNDLNAKPLIVQGGSPPSALGASAIVVEFPREGRVRAYEASSGRKLMDTTIASIAPFYLSPGGRFIVDKYQRLIPIDPAEMFKDAKTWVGRDLSDQERCDSIDDKDACTRVRRAGGVAAR